MCKLLTRRARTVFLVACCQFAFAECTSADPETVARFREQYPEAGKRIEDVYSHIAISSRYRFFEADTFGCEVMLHFIRDGSRFRLIKEMLTTFHHSPFGNQDVILANDSGAIALVAHGGLGDCCWRKKRPLPCSESFVLFSRKNSRRKGRLDE